MYQEGEELREGLNSFVEISRSHPWPLNLHATVIGMLGIPFGKKVELNERAEGVLMQALHTLSAMEEQCMIKLFKEQKSWEEICEELDISAVELYENIFMSIRRLRRPESSYRIRQQGILAWQDGPLPEPVPTDEQKEAVVRLAQKSGLGKEKITVSFIRIKMRINYETALALKKYLEETL